MSRRLIAFLVGGGTLVAFALWTLLGSGLLDDIFRVHWNVSGPLSQAGGPRPDSYDRAATRYYLIAIGAILLATGCSASLMVLLPRSGFRTRAWIYLIFMAILLPASFYNYNQDDHVLPAHAQVIANVVLIFLAATTATWLASTKPTAPDSRVLKYLALTLLLLGGVFVPGLFSLIWLLWASHVLSRAQTEQITFDHITGLSAVVSCVISWLSYRHELRQLAAEDRRTVRIE